MYIFKDKKFEEWFMNLLFNENGGRCNASGRSFMAEKVPVDELLRALEPFPTSSSMEEIKYTEFIGGLKPNESFIYQNAQGSHSIARAVSLYKLPEDMKNPYLYCFSGIMHAPLYAMDALRFYCKQTGKILPFVSTGKEGNKGLFKKLFYRDRGLIRDTEYDSYYRIMAELADRDWVYDNYTECEDDDTEGNLVELYNFAKDKGLDEVTYVMVSGNPYYDKRLLAEWMYQLRQDKFAEVKINLVLAHCPVWFAPNPKAAIPEAQAGSPIEKGYRTAAIGPLLKDTITFAGQTESNHPERLLMPGVTTADWEKVRTPIENDSNMGWPNYQEILYQVPHEKAVANVIISDILTRASYTPEDYDNGLKQMLADYKAFLGGGYDVRKQSFLDYLMNTTDEKFF